MKRVVIIIFAALAATGCATDVCETDECATETYVGKRIAFATEQGEGVAEGFDIDGRISAGTDPQSCNQDDYVAPDGREGIDNQFAVLWEAIEDVIGDAVDGLLVGAINDGNLLFMFEIEGIDDRVNDDCVDVSIFLGSGKPFVGTDGVITAGQTFDINPATPRTTIPCGTIADGILTAGPFDGVIPVRILDVSFDLKVFDALIRGEFADDGSLSVMIGAGVDSAQVIEVAEGADYRLEGLVSTLVNNRSDLARDQFGDCTQLSATMLVDGTPAFIYEDAQ